MGRKPFGATEFTFAQNVMLPLVVLKFDVSALDAYPP